MTIMPIYKTCPKCRRRYLWNPDINKICCPNCSVKEKADKGILGTILKGVLKD